MTSRHPAGRIILALAAVASAGLAVAARQGTPRVVAFTNVNVVPMDRERVLEDQTVIVRDGRIAELGAAKAIAVPAGAQRIDGRGKYLMPGLADMHVHLPPMEGAKGDAADIHMRLYLANGVTTIRGMVGHPANLVLRDRIARGEMTGPTVFAWSPPMNPKVAPDAAAAATFVAAMKAQGFDGIKLHGGVTGEMYEAAVAAGRTHGLPVGGHVTAETGLARALAARPSGIEHLDGYLQALMPKDTPVSPGNWQVVLGPSLSLVDESKMKALAESIKEAGIYSTPTLALFKIVVSQQPPDDYLAWPEMQYISPALRGQFAKQKEGTAMSIQAPAAERARYVELRNRIVKALADAGAPLLVGPDTPQLFLVPGFATHREIRAFVDAGLSPYAALVAATRSPAEAVGRAKEFGLVQAGMRADLLLLDANPLADVANLGKRAGVMVRGRWMPAAEIQQMLDAVAALYRSPQ